MSELQAKLARRRAQIDESERSAAPGTAPTSTHPSQDPTLTAREKALEANHGTDSKAESQADHYAKQREERERRRDHDRAREQAAIKASQEILPQMLAIEAEFKVDVDRDGAERLLREAGGVGSFLLRDKGQTSLVVSYNKLNPRQTNSSRAIHHIIIHRSAGKYQADMGVFPGSYGTISECLGALREALQLAPFVFYKSVQPSPQETSPPPYDVTVTSPDPSPAPAAKGEEEEAEPPSYDASTPPPLPTSTSSGELDDIKSFLDAPDSLDSLSKNLKQSNSFRAEEDRWTRGKASSPLFMDEALFTQAVTTDEYSSLDEVQAENRRLRQQVSELTTQLRRRDEDIVAMNDRITHLLSLVPRELAMSSRDSVGSPRKSEAGGDASKAKDVLQLKLSEFGFDSSQVETVLDDIGGKEMDHESLNEALDRLLSSGPRSTSLEAKPASPARTQHGLYHQHGLESSGFLGGESASNGTRSGATASLSEYGLFDSSESTPQKDSDRLFGGIGVGTSPSTGQQNAKPGSDGDAMAYNDFLSALMRPESHDLVNQVKLFISSVLGPNGDTTPPKRGAQLEYQFYGTHMLQRRCEDFFTSMEDAMRNHVAWKDVGDAVLESARNHLEKYILTKISDYAYADVADPQADQELSKRMELLAFITPDALEVNPNVQIETVLAVAQGELRKLVQFKAPGDKVACIVKCASVIFSMLNLKRGSDNASRPGADDFLPVFIYVVLKAKVPHLVSNCEYIQAYHNPRALMSKAGYCLVNLRSAVEFIQTLDGSVINMDEEDFNSKLSQAEEEYNRTDGLLF